MTATWPEVVDTLMHPPENDVLCAKCGRRCGEHRADTLECPRGRRSRGWPADYGPERFEPKTEKRKAKKKPRTKSAPTDPLRLEGFSVHRVHSHGYPEKGGALGLRVLASRMRPDGVVELVTLYSHAPDDPQTPEEHAARTAFMIVYDQLRGRADAIVAAANEEDG